MIFITKTNAFKRDPESMKLSHPSTFTNPKLFVALAIINVASV